MILSYDSDSESDHDATDPAAAGPGPGPGHRGGIVTRRDPLAGRARAAISSSHGAPAARNSAAVTVSPSRLSSLRH